MTTEIPFSKLAIYLHPRDGLAVARQDIEPGTVLLADEPALPFQRLEVKEKIPAGHKLALTVTVAGAEILRYGYHIGIATQDIAPGEWIHTHNLSVGNQSHSFQIRVVNGHSPASPNLDHFFRGYPRANGQVGTRNYLAVISTVSCSAQTARAIAHAFPSESLAEYPNIDGVVAITHPLGCSVPIGSLSYRYLQRTLFNLTSHPNVGGVVFVSLGCEVNQMADLVKPLQESTAVGPFLTIQEIGGIAKTIEAGVEAVRSLLPNANAVTRTPVPLSALTVALQCGGSDSWSGVTANPLVGMVSDQIVFEGGTVVLAETPEIYGAEHLLTHRAASREVGEKLVDRIHWWEEHAHQSGFSLDNNPSPGNKAGGLTTIYEKSLGAVAKAGSTPLKAVVEYSEKITAKGLVFMDTPGNDPVAVTGQVAGGCNLTLFTTGRGTVYGGMLSPCIKVVSNSTTYQRMQADMDFNAGVILEGEAMKLAAEALLEQVIQVASGMPTKSEQYGFRETEFIPWHLDGIL
jgi:altronate hydrolase